LSLSHITSFTLIFKALLAEGVIFEPAYTVDFPDVPDIITSGATLPEAFRHACEALDLHLETLQKLHLPLPEPKHHLVVQV